MISNEKMSPVDILIINTPALLAFCGFIAGLLIIPLFNGRLFFQIITGVLSWQCLCAAVLLLIDFKRRKIRLFFRILTACDTEKKLSQMTGPLRGTLCGEAMRLAIINRYKKTVLT